MSNKLIKKQYFIIDFDSTFISIETLDELAKIALNNNPDKNKIIKQITATTKRGMEGKISFTQSLNQRLKLFSANKEHVQTLLSQLEEKITPSLLQNSHFPKQFAKQIYIISGGFKEYIVPIVAKLGITEEHVLANTFTYDKKGNITGFDSKNLLSQVNGKAKAVKRLGLKGEIIVVGDGYTDYQIKEQGYAHQFFAFTEHVSRPEVIKKADKVIANFDELLYYFNMPRALSYPKSKIRVLLLGNIHPKAKETFKKEGYSVEEIAKSPDENELIDKLQDVSIVGISSRTY
ncbi:MAG TPA: HAD-IB family phosphatase, partial [Patescibacteria group bacterium]